MNVKEYRLNRRDVEISAINKLLDITLYDWQVAYIFGESNYVTQGRGSGKTLAYVIKLLLSEGEPIHMYDKHIDEWIDAIPGPSYSIWFKYMVREVYYKLSQPGSPLKLRRVYFTSREATEDREV